MPYDAMGNTIRILADIGGTFARFAQTDGKDIWSFKKLKASEYLSLETALAKYCEMESIPDTGTLSIATAAYPDGDVWRFVNKNKWVIAPKCLKEDGWDLHYILNDFEASTWALMGMKDESLTILKEGGLKDRYSKCLIGPGTGLGLGFLTAEENNRWGVQKTHGGHLPISAVTDEQWKIINIVKDKYNDGKAPVFENFVSGPGLYNTYLAVCEMKGVEPKIDSHVNFFYHKDTDEAIDAVRLLHEFYGMFAHAVTVAGHSYGGLYLTGGVLDRLVEYNMFDFDHFYKYFAIKAVKSIEESLAATPIYHVLEPHMAMSGLMYLESRDMAKAA